jgi:hypothetical protein
MDRTLALKKLHAYVKNPALIKEPTMEELADLVTVVLGAVTQIEKAIQAGRLDGKTPEADKDYMSAETAKRLIAGEVNKMLSTADSVLSQTSSEMDRRVQQALQNIRSGNDGIVTDAEIERAAQMASLLIEAPDFDALFAEKVQGNGALVRDALESLPEGEEQLAIAAVQNLRAELDELRSLVGNNLPRGTGGGMSEKRVIQIINEVGGTGGSVSDEAYGGTWDGVTDEAPSKNAVYDKIQALSLGAGTGDVVGPVSSVTNRLATFDGITGKLIKDSGSLVADFATAGHNHTGVYEPADATILKDADIGVTVAAALGADDNYATDAEKVKLSNLSGTNTGDQTNISGNAATVTTNANLTGVVTSVGNATAIADSALSIAKTSGLQTALDAKVAGPASATDNALARFDGTTGKIVQNYTSNAPTATDTGEMSVGYAASTTPVLNLTGGASGTDLIRLIRTSGATSTYGWSLAGGGLAFTDVTNSAIVTNIFGDASTNQLYVGQRGKGVSDAARQSVLSSSSYATGTDISAGTFFIRGGQGTGAGTPGNLEFQTGTALVSGATGQTPTTRLTISPTAITSTLPLSIGTANALTTGTIELGAATDTTISRVSAGVAAIEGNNIITANRTATDTTTGVVELAIASEVNTGTDATRAVTPDALAGSNFGIRYVAVTLNATTALTTSEKAYFRIPAALTGMNLVSVAATVGTGAAGSSSSGTPTFTVKNVTDSNQMLSTSLTVDASEYSSATAAVAAVINTSFDDVVTDDLIEVAVTTAGTGVTYATVTMGFQLP